MYSVYKVALNAYFLIYCQDLVSILEKDCGPTICKQGQLYLLAKMVPA